MTNQCHLLWLCALLLLFLVHEASSFSVETRRSTLFSNDGEHIIGTILERRSDDDGVHEVLVGSTEDVDKGSALKVTLPYFETADSVGSSVWPSALAGSILLQCSSELQKLAKDAEILELGSGLGLGGLIAGNFAARCVLTDNDEELVEKLSQHVLKNQDVLGDNVSAQQLDWRDSDPSKQREPEEDTFDFCMGFDVAYYYHLVAPLINTVRQKLQERKSMLCVLGTTNRNCQWQLFHHLRDGGYNQITDEHEPPWEGTTKMLLYTLKVGMWTDVEDGGEDPRGGGTLPISAIIYTTNDLSVESLTPYDHIATEEDEKTQMRTF